MNALLSALCDPSYEENAPVIHTGRETLTRTELWARVHDAAEMLSKIGARRLALCTENSVGWLCIDLATQLANIPLVPLPGFFSQGQLKAVCQASGVDHLLTDADYLTKELPPATVAGGKVRTWEGMSLYPLANSPVIPLHSGTEKVTFTSGTTGAPKGVCLSHNTLEQVALSLKISTEALHLQRHLCTLPLAVLLENIAGAWTSLLSGGELLLPPLQTLGVQGSSGFRVETFAKALDHWQPDSIILLPQMLQALVTFCENHSRRFPSLKFVAVGGSRVAPSLLERAWALGIPAIEGYGLSECGSVVCLNPPDAPRAGTVGKPLPHCNIRRGEDGELWVTGPAFLGYLGEPPHRGAVPTGDLGTLDPQGYLSIQGRKKNLIISSFGRNISPEWVEAELCQHPAIAQALLFGDGQPWCGAILVPAGPVSDRQLASAIATINSLLPDYARVHRWLTANEPFSVANGQLTANGRPRRDSILHQYQQRIQQLYQAEECSL